MDEAGGLEHSDFIDLILSDLPLVDPGLLIEEDLDRGAFTIEGACRYQMIADEVHISYRHTKILVVDPVLQLPEQGVDHHRHNISFT